MLHKQQSDQARRCIAPVVDPVLRMHDDALWQRVVYRSDEGEGAARPQGERERDECDVRFHGDVL